MGRLISIDPGVKFTGWAYFEDKRMEDCGLIKAKRLNEMFAKCEETLEYYSRHCNQIVIEKPQVYAQRKMKGDANDLITIGLVAGFCASLCLDPHFILPRDWKGTVNKDIMTERIQDRWMNELERGILREAKVAKTYRHNTIDAIGIGLWYLGRHR